MKAPNKDITYYEAIFSQEFLKRLLALEKNREKYGYIRDKKEYIILSDFYKENFGNAYDKVLNEFINKKFKYECE